MTRFEGSLNDDRFQVLVVTQLDVKPSPRAIIYFVGEACATCSIVIKPLIHSRVLLRSFPTNERNSSPNAFPCQCNLNLVRRRDWDRPESNTKTRWCSRSLERKAKNRGKKYQCNHYVTFFLIESNRFRVTITIFITATNWYSDTSRRRERYSSIERGMGKTRRISFTRQHRHLESIPYF